MPCWGLAPFLSSRLKRIKHGGMDEFRRQKKERSYKQHLHNPPSLTLFNAGFLALFPMPPFNRQALASSLSSLLGTG